MKSIFLIKFDPGIGLLLIFALIALSLNFTESQKRASIHKIREFDTQEEIDEKKAFFLKKVRPSSSTLFVI